ncbi:MAG: beta-lactamase family protein [Deltaproteobacteria bacterium]|nr:beta-lactamase family protein [Deltaproteobacteria bacterium]
MSGWAALIRREAERLLRAGVASRAFPGGVAFISCRWPDGQLDEITAVGGTLFPEGEYPARGTALAVREDTIYDLAELTKSVFAAICLRLVERGRISLELRAEQIFPDLKGTVGGVATLEALLRHDAGLAPWGGLYLDLPHEKGSTSARRWILSEAARRSMERGHNRKVQSDLGYIVASEVIVRSTGMDLAAHLRKEIVDPLGLDPLDLCYPPALSIERLGAFHKRVAPTEGDEWRGRWLRGEVHDENCHVMGGISGHAGLFGTARGVGRFARALLDGWMGRPSQLLSKASTDQMVALKGRGGFGIGLSAKHHWGGELIGKRLSDESLGQVGVTGTSFWCDPVHDVVIVLLTNRVCPSRANRKIDGFRPVFHDAILSIIQQGRAAKGSSSQES